MSSKLKAEGSYLVLDKLAPGDYGLRVQNEGTGFHVFTIR
jgi:hypothetical protein